MTMVCLDCQRHEKFTSQYRAMFVFNCTVNFEETLKIPEGADKKALKKQKGKKGRKRKHDESSAGEGTTGSDAVALTVQSNSEEKVEEPAGSSTNSEPGSSVD
jgi:hypothetical protein